MRPRWAHWWVRGLMLCVLALSAAWGEPSLPGTPFPNPEQRRPGDFWLTRNSLELYQEAVFDDHELYLWAFPSTLQADPKIWAPRLAYRWQDRLWLDVGTQRDQADPYVSPLVVNGARLDWDFEPYRLSVGAGRTSQEFLPRTLEGQPEFRMDQVSLARRLGDYGVARVSTSGWSPSTDGLAVLPGYRPPEASRVVSAELVPELPYRFRGVSLAGGYGLETVPVLDSVASDRRAYSWRFGWGLPGLRLDARQRSQGRAYGPNHFENFLRGQDQLTASLTVDPLPGLSLRESYSRYEFAQPLESGQRRAAESETFSHELLARPTQDLNFGLLVSRSLNRNTGSLSLVDVRRWQARADWTASDSLDLSLVYANVDSVGSGGLTTSTQRADLQAAWQLDPRNRLRVLVGRSSVVGLGVRNEGLDLGLGWWHRLPEDLGHLQFDYRRSRFGFSDRSYESYQLSGQFEPDPRWGLNVSAGVYDTGIDVQLSGSVRLSYLIDEHRDLSLFAEQRPFLLFPDLPGLNLSTTSVGIRLRQSFDGPLQRRFEKRLEPRVNLSLEGELPSGEGPRFPIPGAKIRVDNRLVATTDAAGRAVFHPPEGPSSMEVDLSEAGPHFTLLGEPQVALEMGPADRQSFRYRAVAYSGLTVVAWNNFFAEDDLPVGYVPMPGLAVEIDGETHHTDAQGTVRLDRREPGPVEVSVPQSRLPAGLELLESGPHRFELNPGQETVLPVAVRGFATVSGRVQLLGGATVPTQGVGLGVQGRQLGRTDAEGRFEVKVPTGPMVLEIATRELGRRALQLEPPTLNLQPGAESEVSLVLTRSGQVTIRLRPQLSGTLGGPGGPGLEGVPVLQDSGEFLYTDRRGEVRFEGLPAGSYRFELPLESLPEEVRLSGPGSFTVELDHGEEKTIDVPLQLRSSAP